MSNQEIGLIDLLEQLESMRRRIDVLKQQQRDLLADLDDALRRAQTLGPEARNQEIRICSPDGPAGVA